MNDRRASSPTVTERESRLSSFAEALAGTFPAANDAPLARSLLLLLARGRPITEQELAAAAGRSEREVALALRGWPNVDRDAHGAVVAFSGLSLRPTTHRFSVGGRGLYTWCAWDALFLPLLLEQPADVASTCPLTGTPVRLAVTPHTVAAAEPDDVWVSFPPLARTSTDDIVGSFCCHVHFFAGRASAERWLAGNEGGHVLDVHDAYEVGARATAKLRPQAGPAPAS